MKDRLRALDKKTIAAIVATCILIIIAIGLGICSWFLLPDVVTVQVGMDGQVTNTMPKLLAILIPLGISAAGSVINLTDKKEKETRNAEIKPKITVDLKKEDEILESQIEKEGKWRKNNKFNRYSRYFK